METQVKVPRRCDMRRIRIELREELAAEEKHIDRQGDGDDVPKELDGPR